MGCLKRWMYYRWRRSWSAGLSQACSPSAQNPEHVGWQKVESDFTMAVLLLNLQDLNDSWPCVLPLPSENLILVDVLFMESHLPMFAGDTQRGTHGKQIFGKKTSSCWPPCREVSCNWNRMKHPIHLTQVLTKCLNFTSLSGTKVCCWFSFSSKFWMFCSDFLERKGKVLGSIRYLHWLDMEVCIWKEIIVYSCDVCDIGLICVLASQGSFSLCVCLVSSKLKPCFPSASGIHG